MCSPSLAVAKLAMPTSMPARRPVAGSGLVQDVVTREHRHPPPAVTLDLNRLHRPLHRAMHPDLDLADTLQIHPVGIGSQRAPSPSLGHSTESNRAAPKPRMASLLAGPDPAEEPGERPIQPA